MALVKEEISSFLKGTFRLTTKMSFVILNWFPLVQANDESKIKNLLTEKILQILQYSIVDSPITKKNRNQ